MKKLFLNAEGGGLKVLGPFESIAVTGTVLFGDDKEILRQNVGEGGLWTHAGVKYTGFEYIEQPDDNELHGEIRQKCSNCEAIVDEPAEDPIYECPGCGDKFRRSDSEYDNHRSPCCGKFSSKVSDVSCDECGAEGEGEFEQVVVVQCPTCQELVEPS